MSIMTLNFYLHTVVLRIYAIYGNFERYYYFTYYRLTFFSYAMFNFKSCRQCQERMSK